MSISFDVGEDLEAIVAAVRSFAEDRIRPHLREFEEAGALPEALQRELHELGLTTLVLPEALGGDDSLDARAAVLVSEELAWGDIGAAAAIAGPRSAGSLVLALGDDEQQRRLLAPFADEETGWSRRGALALVEGPFGLEPAAIETTARKEGDAYVLDGSKRYVQSATEADLTVVLARVEGSSAPAPWDRLALFAVEGRPDGLQASERSRLLGLGTVRYGSLDLSGVRVPAANRLGTGAAGELWPALRAVVARKKILDAARLVGCARAATEYAVKYAQERKAFGVYLYQHQALAFMMADMATRVDAMRTLAWEAAARFDSGEDAYAFALRAQRYAVEASVDVATDAVQMLGGHGYIQDHPVEKWMRDVRTLGVVDGLIFDDEQAVLAGAEE